MTGEFQYAVHRPVPGRRPGRHRSRGAGGGFEFREHVPLLTDPDPRRLDVLASVRQPFGDLMVRTAHERRSINVFIVADLSASMGFRGVRRKLDVVAEFTRAAGNSARRVGDAFGFLGVGGELSQDIFVPVSRSPGMGDLVADRLLALEPRGRSVAGLAAAAARLGRQRALVFVVSDFHFPLGELDLLLSSLCPHWVVPVAIWDRSEYAPPGTWGITCMRDLETGKTRLLFMRPALRAKLRVAIEHRQARLRECCLRHDVAPLILRNGFDADDVTRYFLDPHGLADDAR